MRIRMGLCLAAVLIILLSGTGRADSTITLTSTAHFDAGTKAPTADENLGIETATDNPGIASGAFELGNLKGDAFNTASADANTAKWTPFHAGGGCASTPVESIASGHLNADVASNFGSDCQGGVMGDATVTGNWDVSVKITETADTGTSLWYLALFNQADFCSGVATDGIAYLDNDGQLQAYTCINTVFVQVGSDTARPSNPYWLRVLRATNTFTFYYSSDGMAFQQDEQTTSASIANPMSVFLSVRIVSPNAATGADYDDYTVTVGTIGAGGFRTAGQWTSAAQADPAPDTITQIMVDYSGVSVANYIDSLTLLDGSSATVFFDGGNLISGTTHAYTVPNAVPGANWKVRLNLTGDGTGTPTITEITISTTTPIPPPVSCFGNSLFGGVLFGIFGILAGVAIFGAIYYGALKDGADLDVTGFGILIVSVIVLVSIVGVLIGVFNSGATIGC